MDRLGFRGHLELVWADVVETTSLNGDPVLRTMDGSALVWSDSKESSQTADKIVVLSNNPATTSCSWEIVHQGKGEVVIFRDGTSYLVIPELSSGFELSDTVRSCGLTVSSTKDSSVFIANTTLIHLTKAKSGFEGKLPSAISSGLLGLGLMMQTRMQETGGEVIRKQCILEETARATAIEIANQNPPYAALTLLGERGWTLIPAGVGVVMKRCLDKEVRLRISNECYLDVPISIGNSTNEGFMDPVTGELKESSIPVSCVDDSLPIFKVRGVYYQMLPQLTPVKDLEKIPSRLKEMRPSLINPGYGIYRHEILDELENPKDHITRLGEVQRQLTKISTGSYSREHDSTELARHWYDSLTNGWNLMHFIIPMSLFHSILLIFMVLVTIVLTKARLWYHLLPGCMIRRPTRGNTREPEEYPMV